MKILLALTVCSLSFFVWQQQNGQNASQPSKPQTQGGAKFRSVSQPPTSPTTAQQDTNHGRGSDDQHKNQSVSIISAPETGTEKQWTERLNVFFTFVLAVTAIFGTCYALQTLKAIKHEAKIATAALKESGKLASAAKNAAEAAGRNADALIAGQRAWVMVDIEFNPSGVGTRSVQGVPVSYGIQVRMNYRNDGQTPAWITERRAKLIIVTDDTIPEHPDLKKADIIAHGTISLAVGKRHGYGHYDTPLECAFNDSADRIQIIYGVVRYRTAFNGTGETIFGYRVTRGWDRLERLELPDWNKNT